MSAGGSVVVSTTVDGCSRPVRRRPFGARALLGGARRGACATFTWLHNRGTFVRARAHERASKQASKPTARGTG